MMINHTSRVTLPTTTFTTTPTIFSTHTCAPSCLLPVYTSVSTNVRLRCMRGLQPGFRTGNRVDAFNFCNEGLTDRDQSLS